MEEEFYTPADVARRFHIDPRTVRSKASTGAWPCISFGPRTIRFTETHIEQIVSLCTRTPTPPKVERRLGTRSRRTN